MKKAKVTCKNPKCIGGRIETTFEQHYGYSNWTVLESGKVSFKCHGCGKYGSSDESDEPNELDNFDIRCLKCMNDEWEFNIQDVDGDEDETNMTCKNCGREIFTEDELELPEIK